METPHRKDPDRCSRTFLLWSSSANPHVYNLKNKETTTLLILIFIILSPAHKWATLLCGWGWDCTCFWINMNVVAKYCLLHIFNYIIIGTVGAWKCKIHLGAYKHLHRASCSPSGGGIVSFRLWLLAYMDGETRRLNTLSLPRFCFNCCKKW